MVHDILGDDPELDVLVLGESQEHREGFLAGAAVPGHEDALGLLDRGARQQGDFEVAGAGCSQPIPLDIGVRIW